jgi:beta-lactamase superfamily II metal-dependent hydrolase
MSSRKKSKDKGRLTWKRLLGGLLAACLLLLLAVSLRQGALHDLARDFLPEDLLPKALREQPGFALHMIDVGQAQALLLTCGDETALVDTGLAGTADKLVNYLAWHGHGALDYLFVTHPHSDHCGGAKDVVQKIGTDVLLIPEYLSEEAALTTAADWVGSTPTPIAVTHTGAQYPLGDARITVLHPAADNGIDDMNDLSLVLQVDYGGKRFLLTGDIGEAVEAQLPDIGKVDVLQVAHHGSYTSSTKAFLADVQPRYALISCGKNNEYGHPHNVVIARLEDAGARIHRTDEEGTLVVRVVEGQIAVTAVNKK